MPSLTYTPGAITYSGGEFNPEPVRFNYTAGRLTLTGGSYDIGVNLSAADGDKLPRLQRQQVYFEDGKATQEFQLRWQRAMERIEQRFTDIESVLVAIQAAQATATAAVQTANATQAAIGLTNSYTDPVGVLTASSAGTVTIAAHSRVYGDGSTATLNSGSVSGFAPGNYVTIYYSDPARAGGAVAYLGTTEAVAQTGDRHIVGTATIPAVGSVDSVGSSPTAPGWILPEDETLKQQMLNVGYAA